MKFVPREFFKDIEYIGEFESVRQIYYIYKKNKDYMLITLSRSRLDSFNANFVSGDCVEFLANKFDGKIVNRQVVEKTKTKLFGDRREKGFKILYTLYVLSVLGIAERINEIPPTRGLKFRINKQG